MKFLRQHAAVKSIGGIVLLLVIFFAIVSAIGYNSFTDALLNQYSDGAFLTAETAAELIEDSVEKLDDFARMDTPQINEHLKNLQSKDHDQRNEYLETLQDNETMLEYLEAWSQLDRLCNSSGSTFIYLILPDRSDYAHITFLFSTINHDSTYKIYDFGFVRDTTNDEYREKYRALYELKAERELVIRDRGYIETDPHITAMIGLKGGDGQVKAILCVQRQMDVLAQARQRYLNKIILTLIILVLLVVVGQSLFLHHTLLRPLKQISDETKRFSKESVKAEKKLSETIRNRDEIGALASSIDRMEERIQDYVASITQITAEKERINTELNLAAQIQSSMLPHIFPPFPDRKELDIYASMDPAKEVGGDFYDFFLIDSDHLGLLIADVSGKGVPAALFMMASKIILQSVAMLGGSPGKILTKTNEAICSNNQAGMFVTVWAGILEISTGNLTAANAGHEYPVLKRADGDFELFRDKHGFVIGGMEGVRYKEYEIRLNPGDKLFLYTDGVPEATDADGEMFGTERIIEALNRVKDSSPEQVLQGVRRDVDDFVKDAEQFDDLTMVCLEYKGKTEEKKMITTEAKTENIEQITAFVDRELEKRDCPARQLNQIRTAIDEIVSNIARYAYTPETGNVTVQFDYDEPERNVLLTFTDEGVPFDPFQRSDPDITLSAEERKIGGLGIFLVRKIMDDVRYIREDGKNILRIRKKI